jgi:hypothetical protein
MRGLQARLLAVMVAAVMALANAAEAHVPARLSYQGVLTQANGVVVDDTFALASSTTPGAPGRRSSPNSSALRSRTGSTT